MNEPSDDRLVIEVFADIWCPFTHVGLRAIRDQRLSSGRDDVVIRVRSWPLELVNGAPLDPDVTNRHAVELREQISPTMFQDLNLDRFPDSTLEALALAVRAYRMSDSLGERMSLTLRDALFESGENIADPVILQRIAAELGVAPPDGADRAAVVADWHEGERRGVLGSPHFFCGTLDAFCPSLDITKSTDSGLSITRDASGLKRFLDLCFASGPAD
jgi:predicted DsbA family dithiol-disulfide isomerase